MRSNGSHFSPLLDLPSRPGSPMIGHSNQASPNPNASSLGTPFHSPDFTSSTPIQRSNSRARRDTESHGPMSPQIPHESRDRPSYGTNGSVDGRTTSRMSMKGRGPRRSLAPTIIARDRAIEKQALVDSAERIYLRYLLPGAEREIYLP